jgi:signal recognition particle receptor subunit beta
LLRPSAALSSVKVVVSGGFGTGKTTFIGSISEIETMDTDASLAGADAALMPTTFDATVPVDFGRVTLDSSLVLYLFGTPGHDGYTFVWDDLSHGAIGAVVLADTRRVRDCIPTIEYFEKRSTPFLLAVNRFPGTHRMGRDEVRAAVGVHDDVPVVECDARERDSVKHTLLTLLDCVLSARSAR